ncbi:SAP domain-containing protein [Parerythrobacter lacustris]|uniref:SAP domain-containing protein n=1 Tax=Parerythrobacter lacustris TaxID=2969984 RepID=A0ABT1XPA5_9SPHN|nr:SAP domain-containing protein [Parerythrobacter lacustris]MCR2833483.1 SAP domain-containing protein [Parerythrobacter lacustris]
MSVYRTNVALLVNGDRVEKGTEVELSDEKAAGFDPVDLSPVSGVPTPAEEPEEVVSLEDMNLAQLKDRAKELGLSTGGSKADLQERIQLHLDGNADEDAAEEPEEGTEGA